MKLFPVLLFFSGISAGFDPTGRVSTLKKKLTELITDRDFKTGHPNRHVNWKSRMISRISKKCDQLTERYRAKLDNCASARRRSLDETDDLVEDRYQMHY